MRVAPSASSGHVVIMVLWKETDGGNQVNTAVAASGNERISFTDSRYKRGFNGLEVYNGDAVDITVRLNGQADGGKAFSVPAGALAVIKPEEGRTFDFLVVVNDSAVNAETAGAIKIRASRSEVLLYD